MVTPTTSSSSHADNVELDWIQLRSSFGSTQVETTKEKLVRKLKENPLVPIGCFLTLGTLSYGLWNFRQGKSQMSQYMMRARIGAQGLTVLALIVGVGMSFTKKPEPGED